MIVEFLNTDEDVNVKALKNPHQSDQFDYFAQKINLIF